MVLTLVMAVYGQPEMLAEQVRVISGYRKEVREKLKVIVVDDHGTPPAEIPDEARELCEWHLFRIEDDIPWNQMGARNLGMHHAEGVCVMLDPDMVISPEKIDDFLRTASRLSPGDVVHFGLKEVGRKGSKINMTSPNTWMIHAQDFWKINGYDEDYAGHKGWSDVQLLAILRGHYRLLPRRDLWVLFYNNQHFHDAQVVTLNRDTAFNKAIHLRKVKEGKLKGWKRWVLSQKHRPVMRFRWTQVF